MTEVYRQYRRKGVSWMRPYVRGEDMTGISVSAPDAAAGSPKEGDFIARNEKNHEDRWLVAAKFCADNYALVEPTADGEAGWEIDPEGVP